MSTAVASYEQYVKTHNKLGLSYHERHHNPFLIYCYNDDAQFALNYITEYQPPQLLLVKGFFVTCKYGKIITAYELAKYVSLNTVGIGSILAYDNGHLILFNILDDIYRREISIKNSDELVVITAATNGDVQSLQKLQGTPINRSIIDYASEQALKNGHTNIYFMLKNNF